MKLLIILLTLTLWVNAQIIDHRHANGIDDITNEQMQEVRDSLNILVGFLSHGGNILSGIEGIYDEYGAGFELPNYTRIAEEVIVENGSDPNWNSRLFRAALDTGAYNVAMLAWCGGIVKSDSVEIMRYINWYDSLDNEYPSIKFVYVTDYINVYKDSALQYDNQTLIRDYCIENNKPLYDFGAIDLHLPDGTLNDYVYPGATYPGYCTWESNWCNAHPEDCFYNGFCEHCGTGYSCTRKGYAFWHLLVSLVDSVSIPDTTTPPDTSVCVSDTIYQLDTVYVYDTVNIYDTVYVYPVVDFIIDFIDDSLTDIYGSFAE